MPSALQASRDFAARAIARARSGIDQAGRDMNQAGPEIKVEPFDAKNVSTPAALIKVASSIGAAQRANANYKQSAEKAKLEAEKTQAEIARLRAEAAYDMGEGRQTGTTAKQPVTLTKGHYAGMTPEEARLDIADRNATTKANGAKARAKTGSNVTAARAQLANIDASVKRDTERAVNLQHDKNLRVLMPALNGKNDKLRNEAIRILGIDSADYTGAYAGPQRAALIAKGLAGLRDRWTQYHQRNIEQFYAPKRAQYQSVIDQAIDTAVSQEPEDTSDQSEQGGFTEVDEQGNPIPAAGAP